MMSKFKKGFSLIELLVVIAIIGILAAVGITAYSGYTAGAKEKATIAQHSQVVALINAEMGRCAAGEGTYVWGTAAVAGREEVIAISAEEALVIDDEAGAEVGTTVARDGVGGIEAADFNPDACSAAPDAGHIALHVNGTGAGQLGMTNAYDATLPFAQSGALGVTLASPLGLSSIYCGAAGAGCQVTTLFKSGESEVDNIASY